MRVLFLIRSLEIGGAERQLTVLAHSLAKKGHEVSIATFYGGGALEGSLRDSGVRLYDLKKNGRWDVIRFIGRFRNLVREFRPDVLYGFMPVSNLICLAARDAMPENARLVWGVRAAFMDLKQYDLLSRLVYWIEARLLSRPDLIIVNSHAGQRLLTVKGAPASRVRVIPNGIDIDFFSPQPDARADVRKSWDVPTDKILIGLVARLDPMKEHDVFLQAAALLLAKRSDVQFVCVGGGDAGRLEALKQLAHNLGIEANVVWPGEIANMPVSYAALDISTNCSYGEGFSNAIAESMACGCPCVVTDVGDSAWIVGETGESVSPRNPGFLVEGWMRMIDRVHDNQALCKEQSRDRIVESFSLENMTTMTIEALSSGEAV
ncbi:MAG: glycosyltransferase [Rhodospirillales bacterium]|nr:glycosyltransferase [Rhodospirillales bacterium]